MSNSSSGASGMWRFLASKLTLAEGTKGIDAIYSAQGVLEKTEEVSAALLARLGSRDVNNLYLYDDLMRVKVLAGLLKHAISDLIPSQSTVRWPDG